MRALRHLLAPALVIVVSATGAACSGGDGAQVEATTTTAAPETTTTTEPPLEAGTQLSVYTPKAGDCFDRRTVPQQGKGQAQIVLKLSCDLPHQNEVFAVVQYPNDGGDFPGEDALETFAKKQCPASFEPYVGRAYEVSELEIGYQLPSAANWGRGNQPLGCYLFDAGGDKLVGSMQGSGR